MRSWSPLDRRRFLQWSTLGAAGIIGCRQNKNERADDANKSAEGREPEALKLVVLDDEPLAAAIREQWGLRGEGSLDVEDARAAELLQLPRAPAADALVFPSGQLGPLVERGWLLPLADDVLRDPNLDWSNTYDLLRLREVLWDRTVFALPLGSPPFFLFYRGDLWDQAGLPAPATWSDYAQALEQLSAADPKDPHGSAEPLGPGWAGHVLLARAAAYALHRGYLAAWFDLDSMEPRVGSAPFERALTELVAACPDPEALEWSPQVTLERLLRGEALGAISWASAHIELGGGAHEAAVAGLRIAELPGGEEAYHYERSEWSPRTADAEGQRVTLLGAAGRQAAVLKRSVHRSAAANLLVLLTGPQWSAQIAAASHATTPARPPTAEEIARWVPAQFSDDGREQYFASLTSAMQRPSAVLSPRIPGRDEYLAALDRAVAAAVRREQTPAAALAAAATEWQAITERLGTEAQRGAYRRSLGL